MPDIIRNKDILDRYIEMYGIESQLYQTIQELAELIHAITKVRLNKWPAVRIIEEATDVKAMLEQLERIYIDPEAWSDRRLYIASKIINEVSGFD